MGKIAAVVLAAGKGTRMKSRLPKVLHKVAGKPMLQHILDTCAQLEVKKTIVVIGHEGEKIIEEIGSQVEYAWQKEQLGTGHALMQAQKFLTPPIETVLVVCGDTPLLKPETLQNLLAYHQREEAAATILTAALADPTGYGRIIRDANLEVQRIVEQKDATPEELLVEEINSGTYCFHLPSLKEALEKIKPDNAQGEYYLTDCIALLKAQGKKVLALKTDDAEEIIGINSRNQLAVAEAIMRRRINEKFMEQGVTIVDPGNTYIESEVQIAPDTIIYPFTFLQGKTTIGRDCQIGPGSTIKDSILADGVVVQHSILVECEIGTNCTIGPFSYLRPGTKLLGDNKIGDFVELKKSVVGRGSKVPHLSYIGDAQIGKNVNIGAGTITCNFDGEKKWPTIIEDGAFIGSNSNLVAPVRIEQDAYVAAGSTITQDVPKESLGVARGKQINISHWATRKKREKDNGQ